jgi:DNA polymerase III sliding clamp (beta) subunit (PCNA family)
MTETESVVRTEMLGSALLRALESVEHAAANDMARPVLATILIEQEGGGLRFVAADNFRIAIRDLELAESLEPDEWPTFLLPVDYLGIVKGFLKLNKGRTVGVDQLPAKDSGVSNTLAVSCMGSTIMVPGRQGPFPNYREVLGIEELEATPPVVTLTAHFLADAGKAFERRTEAGMVEFRATDPLKPILLSAKAAGYREVIMPIRVTPGLKV